MVRDMRHLERLVRELAELAPEERVRVVAEAAQRGRPQAPRAKFSVPILKGGTAWVGGELRREELYCDDGR
jgi:hypothetical protein